MIWFLFSLISHSFITHLLEGKTSQGIRESFTAHFSTAARWFRDELKKETQAAKMPKNQRKRMSMNWEHL